jgi:small-conductance mechanosensitive channel
MVTDLQAAAQLISVSVGTVALEELVRAGSVRVAKRAGVGRTAIRDLGAALRLIAVVVIVSAFFRITGFASELDVLTLSGIAALTVTLALQTTLSNVISGILLFYDGSVRLHDEVEYSGIKGKVERVSLRATWIKTQDGRIVVVSNSTLSNGPLIIHSATERLSKRYAIE